MRPPICEVCHEQFSPREGGQVRFANFQRLPDRMVGHPKGLGWFCGQHLEAAQGLAALSMGEAVGRLRADFGRT